MILFWQIEGVNINASVALKVAKLEIPAYTKEKTQLSSLEGEGPRRLANMWMHVERDIVLLRQKYQILSGILPIETVYSDNSDPQIDKTASMLCSYKYL